jgi:Uma2 family endonuclease
METTEKEIELSIKIPIQLKKELDNQQVDIPRVVLTALKKATHKSILPPQYGEKKFPKHKSANSITASDIPPGHFAKLPHLTLEEFEAIVDESSWEYLDVFLIHHSPESNYHNIVLNSLVIRAAETLDKQKYTFRTSRVALSIGEDKPEPDFMIFDRKNFHTRARKNGTSSEIIDSPSLIVIEIVSESSLEIDVQKTEKYLQKGVHEYWQIHIHHTPLKVEQAILKENQYISKQFIEGNIKSEIIPEFNLNIDQILYPEL